MIEEIKAIGGSFSLLCPPFLEVYDLTSTLFPTDISVFRINNRLQLGEFA